MSPSRRRIHNRRRASLSSDAHTEDPALLKPLPEVAALPSALKSSSPIKQFQPGLVSILLNTHKRQALTCKILHKILNNTGYDNFEILINENGTNDIQFINKLKRCKNLVFLKENTENKGIYWGLNQMLYRAQGEYLCKIDSDMDFPKQWLARLVSLNQQIPASGVSSIYVTQQFPPIVKMNGVNVRHAPTQNGSGTVFGMFFFHRNIFNLVGFFNEAFGKYGGGDTDFCRRIIIGGYKCYYVPEMKANHYHDAETDSKQSAYRQMKDKEIRESMRIKNAWHQHYVATKQIYLPASPRCEQGVLIDLTNKGASDG